MSKPPVTLPIFGSVREIATKLYNSSHSAFPVVEHDGGVFRGSILRNHVVCILAREDVFMDQTHSEVKLFFLKFKSFEFLPSYLFQFPKKSITHTSFFFF